MSASTATPHDTAFEAIYKSCQAQGMGGDLKFVDAFFSFLRRRTPLLTSQASVEQVQGLALKHVELAKKQPKESTASSTAAAAKSTPKSTTTPAPATTTSASTAASSSTTPTPAAVASATELKDADEEAPTDEDKLPTPVGNGGTTDKYRWTQSLAEVNVSIPLPLGTTSKQLKVTIEPNQLYAGLTTGDKTVFLNGTPDEKIDSSDATWTIEDDRGQKSLEIFLPKMNKMSWWKCVVKGDPAINTKKIVPENSKLEDLDGDTRGTVEKMMFDQRQKQMGKPTSDDLTKQQALKRFMDMHPEMDFSQAKIQ